MPTIQSIEVRTLHLPFRQSFSHSLAKRLETESVLVILKTTSGVVGYGEGTPRDYVTGERLADTVDVLQQYNQRLRGTSYHSLEDIAHISPDNFFDQFPSAKCALELALLDALGKEKKSTSLELFGATVREQIEYSAVMTGDSLQVVEPLAKLAAQFGLQSVKLKLGNDLAQNLALTRLVKEHLPTAHLRADVNAGWNLQQAMEQIPPLAEEGIQIIEQPLPVANREDFPRLQAAMKGVAEIMVDESMVTLNDAQWFFDHGGADRFLLKISKQGGIIPTLHLANLCAMRGIPVHLGAHVGETSLLSAAGRIAAAQFPFATVEGSFGTLLLQEDLTDEPLMFGKGGWAPARYSNLPGLGVEVIPQRI